MSPRKRAPGIKRIHASYTIAPEILKGFEDAAGNFAKSAIIELLMVHFIEDMELRNKIFEAFKEIPKELIIP